MPAIFHMEADNCQIGYEVPSNAKQTLEPSKFETIDKI